VAEDAQVSFVNGTDARRSLFKPSCIRIVEDSRDFLRSCLILEFGQENPADAILLFGSRASCGRVSLTLRDVQPAFAANSIFITLPDVSSGWIIALPTKDALVNLTDCLRFAGCIMGDLQDHVAFASAYKRGVLLGRPTNPRMATTADVVALKSARSKRKSAEAQLLNEVQFLLRLEHPGILRAHGVYEVRTHRGDPGLGLLLEYAGGRDLSRWIPEAGLPAAILRVLMADLCSVLAYIHGRLIVHRDIKPSNVLCDRARDGSVRVILADFGLAAHVADVSAISKRCGTPGYTAPEMLQKDWGAGCLEDSTPITKIDMFSFGVMIYTALVGSNPFVGSTQDVSLRQNKLGLLPFESDAFRNLSDDLQELLRNLCAIAPSERCTSSEASLKPWLYAVCNEKLSWDVFEEAARTCKRRPKVS
jgi:serine/threonine protein kinase